MGTTCLRWLPPVLLLAAGLSAASAWAQEEGVRRLPAYREVSPHEEIPSLPSAALRVKPESEIDLGFGRLYGFLAERLVYDDNLFLADHGEESDFLLLTTPGIFTESFLGDHRLRLSYAPTLRTYAKNDALSTWTHDASGDLRLDFPDAYVRLADSFVRTQETRDIRYRGQVDRTTNRAMAEAGFLFGYLGLGARYENRLRSYDKEIPSFSDFREDLAGLFAWYGLDPDYDLLAEYAALFRHYRGDVLNDSTTHTLLAGFDARPQEGLRLLLKAGPVLLEADEDGTVGDDSDLFTLAVEAETRLELTPGLLATLFYVQRPEYATHSNYQMAYRGGLGAVWELEPDWVSLSADFFLERARRSNEPNLWLIGVGIALELKITTWLKGAAGYEWKQRDGRGDLGYSDNQVYLQLVLHF